VKILFPDLDTDILKEADSLKVIMDGKLVFWRIMLKKNNFLT
jgi:hypothetical protein